jgi:hypothetical protein
VNEASVTESPCGDLSKRDRWGPRTGTSSCRPNRFLSERLPRGALGDYLTFALAFLRSAQYFFIRSETAPSHRAML